MHRIDRAVHPDFETVAFLGVDSEQTLDESFIATGEVGGEGVDHRTVGEDESCSLRHSGVLEGFPDAFGSDFAEVLERFLLLRRPRARIQADLAGRHDEREVGLIRWQENVRDLHRLDFVHDADSGQLERVPSPDGFGVPEERDVIQSCDDGTHLACLRGGVGEVEVTESVRHGRFFDVLGGEMTC